MAKIYLPIVLFFVSTLYAQKPPIKATGKNYVGTTLVAEDKVPGTKVRMITDSGTIVIRLYDKTPLHRDNFIKLVQQHYYDSLLFHRVIQHFMIQGGDPDSKYAKTGQQLGNGGPAYTIPAEFDSGLFHKKGVIAAAREGDFQNPTKASSGSQFYIVQGKVFSDSELNLIEGQRNIIIPPSHRQMYKTIGGTPHLDMNYTVFGEVEQGLEVIDKIASVTKDGADRPLTDVRMKIEILPDRIVAPLKVKKKMKTTKKIHTIKVK